MISCLRHIKIYVVTQNSRGIRPYSKWLTLIMKISPLRKHPARKVSTVRRRMFSLISSSYHHVIFSSRTCREHQQYFGSNNSLIDGFFDYVSYNIFIGYEILAMEQILMQIRNMAIKYAINVSSGTSVRRIIN